MFVTNLTWFYKLKMYLFQLSSTSTQVELLQTDYSGRVPLMKESVVDEWMSNWMQESWIPVILWYEYVKMLIFAESFLSCQQV